MSEHAQRLGAALLIFGLVDERPADALVALESCPLLTPAEMAAWRDADEQDAALARACLPVERELRDAQWRALGLHDLALHGPPADEARGEARPPEGNSTGDTSCPGLVRVERADLARVSQFVLGWDRAAPEE